MFSVSCGLVLISGGHGYAMSGEEVIEMLERLQSFESELEASEK